MSSEGVEVEGGAVEEVRVGLEHPLFGARIDPVDFNFHATGCVPLFIIAAGSKRWDRAFGMC